MTQEDKELLIKDLGARLRYKVNVRLYEKETCILMGIDGYNVYLDVDSDSFRIEDIEPYLRPMSSMTEDELYELRDIFNYDIEFDDGGLEIVNSEFDSFSYLEICAITDWLNAHHFDYRGLIEKGLALEAPKGMYK